MSAIDINGKDQGNPAVNGANPKPNFTEEQLERIKARKRREFQTAFATVIMGNLMARQLINIDYADPHATDFYKDGVEALSFFIGKLMGDNDIPSSIWELVYNIADDARD